LVTAFEGAVGAASVTNRQSDDLKVFRQVLRMLREHAPPILPVRVRRVKNLGERAGCLGECGMVENLRGRPIRFEVFLDADLRGPLLIEALTHEWAHALGWTTNHPVFKFHTDLWGVAYAMAYRVVEGVI
jgi:hypothetical protein